jgi:RNA polymerase sigma factor (sigma-70 family)
MKKPLPNNTATILRLFDIRLEKEIIEKYDLSIAPTDLPDSVREQVIRRYTYLFKFRLRFHTNGAHYADVQQEVALALLLAWPKWDRKRGYFGHIATMYVVRMLREYESRMCYSATLPKDYFTRKKRYSFHDPENFIANVSQGEEDRREDHYATFEDKRTVSQCLRCLPHMQRKTVEMKYFKGMDEKSIGEALGYSRQYIYLLLNQAYERMRVYALMLKPEEV